MCCARRRLLRFIDFVSITMRGEKRMTTYKRTPIDGIYQRLGARMMAFGGYLMPVQISGIRQEHQAVRTRAGLFDVSHMGEFRVEGSGAETFLQRMVTNDVSRARPQEAMYTAMCYEDGGTVDDLIIYRFSSDRFMLVVNAANIEKDFAWLDEHRSGHVDMTDASREIALLAIQGPLAGSILQKLADIDLDAIDRFHFKEDVQLAGVAALVSRTGYTGEDGYEIYCPWNRAAALWEKIMAAGAEKGLLACGLGARDTLRLEARLPLYGQELSRAISPLEAGIGFAVKTKKAADFIGKEALARQRANGVPRKIVGIEMIERAIPRSHYSIYVGDLQIGEITSGTQSPTLRKNIGLALIASDYATTGTEIEVDIRGKRKRAHVVKTPFYKRT